MSAVNKHKRSPKLGTTGWGKWSAGNLQNIKICPY